jgi:hypothetical protein
MQRRAGGWVLIGLLLVTGCAGVARGLQDPAWQQILQTAEARKDRREVGTVEGLLYLRQPGVPTPLRNAPVTLIPLTPQLEAAVADARAQYATGGFQPLSPEAFAQAHRPITVAVQRLRASRYRDLAQEVKTASSADPEFRFHNVPAGRWLLLAELPSSVSTLLWAVPVTVTAETITRQSLNDETVWIEGLTPKPDSAP